MSIDVEFDTKHIWHPYTSMTAPIPAYPVVGAKGVSLTLENGKEIIDGMASWWSVIHGYNNPEINTVIKAQIDKFSHVMFGGLTHEPVIELCKTLVDITPSSLTKVFISDSGSVAVEVSLKMAIQYWQSKNRPNKAKFLSLQKGYHGDTVGAMSVCDPVTGMHSLFSQFLPQNFFAPEPKLGFSDEWCESDIKPLRHILEQNHNQIAALILEPIVQGAGGMRMYHPEYLKRCRQLCNEYDILLIADEIATGFGRTGRLFACEHAEIEPDIMCLGKSLTGGYVSLAATLCNADIAETISKGAAGVFMHGPTFMGNPLACSAANASLSLLLESDWQTNVKQIEQDLIDLLSPIKNHEKVADVRVLGAIGVIEATEKVNVSNIQKTFIDEGIWLRPFGKLIYMMPPYIMKRHHIEAIASAIATALDKADSFSA